MKISFYEMLGVPHKATQEQIDEAYARLTEKLGATTSVRGTADTMTQLSMIRDGYKILSDPEKRAVYDAKLYANEAGIQLMFFPKDTKAVKKLGINSIVFAILACVFTYVVYQKLTREVGTAPAEQARADKPKAETPKADAQKAEIPGKAPTPIEPPANPPDAKAVGKAGEK